MTRSYSACTTVVSSELAFEVQRARFVCISRRIVMAFRYAELCPFRRLDLSKRYHEPWIIVVKYWEQKNKTELNRLLSTGERFNRVECLRDARDLLLEPGTFPLFLGGSLDVDGDGKKLGESYIDEYAKALQTAENSGFVQSLSGHKAWGEQRKNILQNHDAIELSRDHDLLQEALMKMQEELSAKCPQVWTPSLPSDSGVCAQNTDPLPGTSSTHAVRAPEVVWLDKEVDEPVGECQQVGAARREPRKSSRPISKPKYLDENYEVEWE